MNNKGIIIGIGGLKHSGKDTVANMLNYIIRVGTDRTNFQKWLNYKTANKDKAINILHFADKLKDNLSNMLCIPREYFDDIKYKDELWYCFESGTFIEEEKSEGYIKITTEQLLNSAIIERISTKLAKHHNHIIKLRTLLQYYATICKYYFYDNIWVIPTINQAREIAYKYDYCIIADVRMKNEEEYIHFGKRGFVIQVDRASCQKEFHESEQLNFTPDYTIHNDSTMIALFYNVIEAIKCLNNNLLK